MNVHVLFVQFVNSNDILLRSDGKLVYCSDGHLIFDT